MWEARSSPWRLSLLIVLALGFVVIGVVIALQGGAVSQMVGGLSVLFFGGCGIAAAIRLARGPQAEIAVSADGLFWRHWSDHRIAWQDVERVEIRRQRRQQPFLCLWLRAGSSADDRRSTSGTPLATRMGFGDIALTTIGTNRSFDELVEAVARYVPVER
ncbi:STM3941 family protein [Sphingomonas hankookensis]|uniref:STM3941 family protein n=1 Tax=Sphingomonas hankookensis TaxID=563996 RepID=UPI001F591DF3|nr:STM3941 family protein [Sphingomonas hankookensis]